MNPESVINHPSRLSALLLALACSTSALDLSGKVVNPDGSGRGGVAVSLSGSALAAVTASDGTWAFSGTTGVQSRSVPFTHPSGNLRIQEGRLRVVLSGRDLSGRFLSSESRGSNRSTVSAPRSLGAVPDTLVFRSNGKVFLRDTVSESRSGMVRVFDTTWNANIVYGYLIDARDGQTYRTVKIGNQVWMVQNLNFYGAGADSGLAFENKPDSARKYGRQYMWASVSRGLEQSLCPKGWHVPSDREWQILELAVGMSPTDTGKFSNLRGGVVVNSKFKSYYGWFNSVSNTTDGGGTDAFGFRVLPYDGFFGGRFNPPSGQGAGFWTRTEYGDFNSCSGPCPNAYYRGVVGTLGIDRLPLAKDNWYSIRCLRD